MFRGEPRSLRRARRVVVRFAASCWQADDEHAVRIISDRSRMIFAVESTCCSSKSRFGRKAFCAGGAVGYGQADVRPLAA